MKGIDLSGREFGKLKVIRKTDKRYKRGIVWLCECKCGNKEYYVPSDFLLNHGVTHCNLCAWENNGGSDKVFVEETNIAIIKSNKIYGHNTSGVRGVYFHKKNNKWVAYINFKRKRYNLGSRVNKEDAIKLREEAEGKLYGEFLEWYKTNIKKEID
ncbi:MAG: AP2 domain-containing protein [Clostridium sp.]|nr:AP2 domain-containing protein [Clostridium sp.]